MWRILLFGVFFTVLSPAWAQMAVPPAIPQSCDAQFHDVLRTKAWMEAQREIEVAQTLIQKPDSVMDYSCFKTRAMNVAGSSIFGDSLTSHVNRVLAGAPAGCLDMNAVWTAMKCQDADRSRIMPDFVDMLWGGDKRYCFNPQRGMQWQMSMMRMYPQLQRSVQAGGYDWSSTFSAKSDGEACANSAIIKTGATYEIGGEAQDDAICVAPGCSYDGSKCVTSEAKGEAVEGAEVLVNTP